MKVISIVNQKGGVGKTTTAINLATALSTVSKKILVIDLDPQGNCTTAFGIKEKDIDKTIYAGLVEGKNNLVRDTMIPNLSVIPANVDLSAAEIDIANKEKREFLLKEYIATLKGEYDFIIIDCPPSLGLLTINSLTASTDILIPMQCEFFALEGLSHLLHTVKLIKKSLNKELNILGILFTMYDARNRLTKQVERDVRKHLGDKVYKTVIPRNVRVSEAPSHGVPAIIYDIKCAGSQSYIKLAKEILQS